jgi:hypothetical protein
MGVDGYPAEGGHTSLLQDENGHFDTIPSKTIGIALLYTKLIPSVKLGIMRNTVPDVIRNDSELFKDSLK